MRPLAWTALLLVGCASARSGPPPADPTRMRRELAESLVAYGEWSAASRPLLELAARAPEDPEVHALLADVYREQGLYEQAEREYQIALGLQPDSPRALGGLGVLQNLRGDPGDGALASLRRATGVQPQNPAHHNNLGFALYVRGQYRDASEAFGEALRLDPTSTLARNNLGFAYGRLGELERARREFERAGGPATAANNVGLLQEMDGDYAAACESYRDAIALDGTLKVAFVNAERACAKKHPPSRSVP